MYLVYYLCHSCFCTFFILPTLLRKVMQFLVAFKFVPYRIAQIFRWIKILLNAHTSYWHKNFAEFNFAHSASCSPGSNGWSSWMNMPRRRPGPNIKCHICMCVHVQCTRSLAWSISRFLVSLILLAARRSQQHWPLQWWKVIAPTIGVLQDWAILEVQCGSMTVATSS